MKKLIVLLLLFTQTLYAVDDIKLTDLDELTAIADTDIMYVVDDPTGTPLQRKITILNLFDTIDTFSELNTIVADKTLVNEEDAATWDVLGTFSLGLILTGADANPDAPGEIVYDNSITGIMSGGGLRWFDNDSVRLLVDLETDPSNDDYVVTYDSTADGFYMKADADSGGATAWDDIGDPDNDGTTTIDFDHASENTLFTTIYDAAGSFWTIRNSDADVGNQVYLLDLDYSVDDDQALADYIICQDAGGAVFTVQQNGVVAAGSTITAVGSFIIGNADMAEADLEKLDGITNGTAAANKTIVLSAGSDVSSGVDSFTATTLTDGTASLSGGALTGITTAHTVAQGGTGATSLNDGFVLLGSNTAAITPLDVTTDGGIIIGDGTTDPVVLDVGSSAAITILGTVATGVWQGTAIADAYVDDNITIDLATLASTVTVADESTDTTCFPAFVTAATGSLAAKTGSNLTFDSATGTLGATIFKTAANIKDEPKHMIFTIIDPLATQTEDNEICIWPVTPAALTVTKIVVTLDAVDNEVAGDLKWADAFIGLAGATVINTFDTSSGVLSDDSITAGTVGAGKCIYIAFDSAPNTAIKQMSVDVTYDYD